MLREIVECGGDASLVEARFVEGLADEQIESLFHAARDADYAQIAEDTRTLLDQLPPRRALDDHERSELETNLGRLRRRVGEVATIDFFGAPGRLAADAILARLDARASGTVQHEKSVAAEAHSAPHGAVWVTRKGIHVDRMASAWLIRRFIDPQARFKFVPGNDRGYHPEPGELRFDMFDGEYTHEGDRCSFEVLMEKFRLEERALRPIAELVHDIDLKDNKFGRPETAGLELLVAGMALAHREDEARLERAAAVLDDLYEFFKRKR